MKLWMLAFTLLPLLGCVYVLWHIWHILPFAACWRWTVTGVLALCAISFFLSFALDIDNMPFWLATLLYETGTAALFILIYLVMTFLVLDIGRLVRLVPKTFLFDSAAGSATVFVLIAGIFIYGYFKFLHKERVPLELTTEKTLSVVNKELKIVMISDLHLGYTIRLDEFKGWIDKLNAENADLILIGGDIIDRSLRAVNDQEMAQEFHRLNAPVYACLGNHEYLSGVDGSVEFYKAAGIHLLRDETATVKGINIIGRDDRSNMRRKPLAQLTEQLDMSRYTILLDHQPYSLEKAEQAGIDFQLSGHTHYGQVWPISWIEDAIYEDAFGPLTKGNTQYYVTSGIGLWGGKFRIGTRSEYVVAQLKAK